MDYMKDMHELCETISEAIAEANEKIRSAGGKLTAGDVDYVDKLTHALKSVKAVIGMDEDEEYSGYYPMSYRGSYNRGSYARNRRRDSMGRYSGERGYSRHDGMVEELRELAEDAPNESIKREMHRLVEKIEQMQ